MEIEIKINDILHTANEANDIKKLQECYKKLKGVVDNKKFEKKYAKQYEEKLEECKDEIINSAEKIIEKLNEYDTQNDVFRYEVNNKNKLENRKLLFNMQKNICSSDDYKEALKYYKELQQFTIEVLQEYNNRLSRHYYSYNELSIPTFIDEKEILDRLQEVSIDFNDDSSDNINDINIDTILEEIFSDSDNTTIGSIETTMPKIIDYDNNLKFKNKDLITTSNDIETSLFFKALLNIINKTISGIKNIYEKAKNTTPGYLTKGQEDINKRIANTVTKTFNMIYGKSGDDSYSFDIKLDKNEISLSIFKGGDVVVLDDQSAGFKWFFNLYFNLLNGKILKQGDIVLMDEPAHNLSPKARKECADLLRKYGEENGITFVIVTHDIFWVNIDYLNELRVIANREDKALKGVYIQNDFSQIKSSDTDTLLSIKKAFGVAGSHVFYPTNTRIIFVEGITDYNYLTTFKLLWEKENGLLNIAFLPICGLGKKNEKEIVLEKLMGFDDPILLIDSDIAKEIEAIKKDKGYEKLEIIKLNDVDSSFKEIENLFSKTIKEKYNLNVKSRFLSASFKKHILWNGEQNLVDDTTKQNFYKVLKHLNVDI